MYLDSDATIIFDMIRKDSIHALFGEFKTTSFFYNVTTGNISKAMDSKFELVGDINDTIEFF